MQRTEEYDVFRPEPGGGRAAAISGSEALIGKTVSLLALGAVIMYQACKIIQTAIAV